MLARMMLASSRLLLRSFSSITAAALSALLTACGGNAAGGGATNESGGDAGGQAAMTRPDAAPDGGGGETSVPDGPAPPLPSPSGTCPAFVNGMATFTVNGEERQAKIWIDEDASAAKDGPLILYWYGTAGSPDQVEKNVVSGTGALLPEGVARITGAGGIVVAPVHNMADSVTFPWIQANGADLPLADEIVACAEQEAGIDDRHIHSLGFSAGALFTAQLSYARSSYLASVATYSGGGGSPDTNEDPSNKFAAMILFGGMSDMLVLNFGDQSQTYYDDLTAAGHFAFLCNHGGGHRIPDGAQASVIQFFFDHPYGTDPSPYAGGLPAGFPSYCTL